MSQSRLRSARLLSVLILVTSTFIAVPPAQPAAAVTEQQPQAREVDRSEIPSEDRDRLLSPQWRTSTDLAWTTSGDATGFHLLVAEARTGYTWRTLATLAEPGFETDRWIGNVCLTGSGGRAVVVYAPRQFTNREELFARGGFTAVVDVNSGRVTKLGVTASLAYYNPGCGTSETVVLTQSGHSQFGRTRLHVMDAANGAVLRKHELAGQVTSAIPSGDNVVAAAGSGLVEVAADGKQRTVAITKGSPFALRSGADGVTFLQARGDSDAVVSHLHGGKVREIATGSLTELALARGAQGQVFITGNPTVTTALPPRVRHLRAPVNAEVSTHGEVTLTHAAAKMVAVAPDAAPPVALRMSVARTDATVDFKVSPGVPKAETAETAEPAGVQAAPGFAVTNNTVTHDPDKSCAVARNDPTIQVYQPSWTQVEWAADLAIQGALNVQRPSNWRNSGLAAWTPQGMFPRRGLATGPQDRVPAPILLGVLAQESNLWQASSHVLEGDAGNPLIGNFYGRSRTPGDDPWEINWAEADCGYGVAQVTDGMRLTDTSRTDAQKKAIAVDYASNIAAGLQILEEKFNQTTARGITVNSGNPKWIENWFAALWAYNTGLQPRDAASGNPSGCMPGPNCTDPYGNWGLGWFNNPINPEYPANRPAFLDGDTYEHAKHPQDWPYPEKVMGWAGFPIVKSDPWTGAMHGGYQQAWWTHVYFRTRVKPPRSLFCTAANHCNPDNASPCLRADLHCWWNTSAVYKPSCLGKVPPSSEDSVSCGQENTNLAFKPGAPEPPEKTNWYRPDCTIPANLAGAYIIDDVPNHIPAIHGTTCAHPRPYSSSGELKFSFQADSSGKYRSKIDFHQIGGGLGGHFWFGMTQKPPGQDQFKVTGTWTLNRTLLDKWARVLVYIPDHGSRTQQAHYYVNVGDGSAPKLRVVNAKNNWKERKGRWVPLGVFRFNGTPSVSLSNFVSGDSDSKKVAWDAIAIQPLNAKPRNFVVSLGDSYSSGEGATTDLASGADYFRETDADGDNANEQNACHRSRLSWTRKATLKDAPNTPIGSRADTLDPHMDLHEIACAGAFTHHLLPYGETNDFGRSARDWFGEVPQLSAGYLDENTTLVTFSIGGNDVRFSEVLEQCLKDTNNLVPCQNTTYPGDTKPLGEAEDDLIHFKYLPTLQKVLRRIHQLAPNAKIMVMGYPELVSNDGSCLSPYTIRDPRYGLPLVRPGLSPVEAQWMNTVAGTLAGAGRSAVLTEASLRGIPAKFIDARPNFAGAGVCGGPPTAINALVPTYTEGEIPEVQVPDNPWWRIGLSLQSFHPNPLGTTFYSQALVATLRLPDVNL